MGTRRRRSVEQIVEEVGRAQAKAQFLEVAASDTITIEVTLTFDELCALTEHVDRFIDEKSKLNQLKTEAERHELNAMSAIQEAWPYRWRGDRFP